MYNLPPPPHAALGVYPSPLLQGGTKGEEKGGFPRKRYTALPYTPLLSYMIARISGTKGTIYILFAKNRYTFFFTASSLVLHPIICAVFTQLYPRMYR